MSENGDPMYPSQGNNFQDGSYQEAMSHQGFQMPPNRDVAAGRHFGQGSAVGGPVMTHQGPYMHQQPAKQFSQVDPRAPQPQHRAPPSQAGSYRPEMMQQAPVNHMVPDNRNIVETHVIPDNQNMVVKTITETGPNGDIVYYNTLEEAREAAMRMQQRENHRGPLERQVEPATEPVNMDRYGQGNNQTYQQPREAYQPPQGHQPPQGYQPPQGHQAPQGYQPPQGHQAPQGYQPAHAPYQPSHGPHQQPREPYQPERNQYEPQREEAQEPDKAEVQPDSAASPEMLSGNEEERAEDEQPKVEEAEKTEVQQPAVVEESAAATETTPKKKKKKKSSKSKKKKKADKKRRYGFF